MSVLVIAEHDNTELKKATHHVVTAALAIDADVHVLVAGNKIDSIADNAAAISGVATVICADAACYEHALAESLAPLIVSVAEKYTHVLAPASTFGKNIIPRAAALADSQPLSDILSVDSSDTFKRPIYAGNVIATVKMDDPIKFLTVRTTAFDAAVKDEKNNAPINALDTTQNQTLSTFESQRLAQNNRPELTSAKIVVSGGRGVQSEENFALLFELADTLNAAVGASRAAVDAGFVPNDMQVGQTGKVVAPELYIAVGISGAIQHLAGMKDSKFIVAINKDEEAPIFQVADYGLVADLFEAVPELIEALKS